MGRCVYKTVFAFVHNYDGQWSGGSKVATENAVDKAIDDAHCVLVGRHGMCDIVNVSMATVSSKHGSDYVDTLVITVMAELRGGQEPQP